MQNHKTIRYHLKSIKQENDKFNRCRISQLTSVDCALKHTSQTGSTFKFHFKEQVQSIRTNSRNSEYTQHILDTDQQHIILYT